MSEIAVPFLALFGVVLGALLQFVFSRATDRQRQIGELRAQSYSDYLRATALSDHLVTDGDFVDALRAAADAKARIVIYGSREVIHALAVFERTRAALSSAESRSAYVQLVRAMRPGTEAVPDEIIELVLMGEASLSERIRR